MSETNTRKKILVANDDGIEARGIHALAEALSEKADVYVCAPDREMSAKSHSLTMGLVPVDFMEVRFSGAVKAYAVTGTPADCVKIGLGMLEAQGVSIDYVYSGINHGYNNGTDTLYSGTVSAALEGAISGKSSVAVSVAGHHASHFEYACDLAVYLVDELDRLHEKKGIPIMLNVNTPDLPKEEIAGTKLTRLGYRGYDDFLQRQENDRVTASFVYRGDMVVYDSKNTGIDVIAAQEGYATITPLHYDLTDRDLLAEMQAMHAERFPDEKL